MANEIQRLNCSGITVAGDLSIGGPDTNASVINADSGAGGLDLDSLKGAIAEAWGYFSSDFDAIDNGNSTYDIEFVGALAGSNQPQATVASFNGTASPTPFFTTIQEGGAGTASRNTSHPSGYFYGYSP